MRCRKCQKERSFDRFMVGRKTCTDCIVQNNYKNRRQWLDGWLEYLSDRHPNPSCAVCSIELEWQSNDKKTSVFLDHRHGDEPIKGRPYGWMRSRPCIDKHVYIFELCDFGILCNTCNLRLPTNNRQEWLENATNYLNSYAKTK